MEIDPAQQRAIDTMLGRVNALHTFCMVIALNLPEACAAQAKAALQEATERNIADMLALPISDAHRQEMQRVLVELSSLFGQPRGQ